DRSRGLAAEGFEPILQQEYADQIARRLGREEVRDGAGLGLEGAAAVGAVACPQLDDGVRRRVVLATRLLRDLPDEGAVREPAHERPAQHALGEPGPMRRRRTEDQLARGRAQLAL